MKKHGYDYDLIVIGGGSGGLAGAFRAVSHGASVAMMEPNELGGTCVNVGCVPKKAMWLAAELSHRASLAGQVGFDLPAPTLDWTQFVVHRQRYIAGIHTSYRNRLDTTGVVHLPHRGRLVDAHTVQADDGIRFTADKLLIATGGRPRRPAIPGAELGLVSDDFFDLIEAPERVAIVGGGYVSVELAGVLQALGSRVEIFARRQRLLDSFEEEVTDALQDNLRQHGVRLHFGFKASALHRDGVAGVRLAFTTGDTSETFDKVILATGRQPNTEGLGLEQAGVQLDRYGFIMVDDYQTTSAPNIFAVGDVTPRPALTPVAIAAARRLMDRVYGGKVDAKLDYDTIATVIFAHPPLARVGLTEAEARARFGDSVSVYRSNFRPMLHALANSPQRSLFKLVCAGEDERVVGLHLVGEGSDEIMQGFAVAIKRGITKQDLDDTVAIHPTAAEEVVLMT